MEQNKIVTYYVIKDLATWTTRGCKQSVCERYEHAEEAMQQFRDYAQWQTVIEDKRIRATLGIRIKGLDHIISNNFVLFHLLFSSFLFLLHCYIRWLFLEKICYWLKSYVINKITIRFPIPM